VTVGSLLPECATPPLADTPIAAGGIASALPFAALFGQSLKEAPAEETRPEEKEKGAPAAPVVVTGFTVPVVWLALEAPLPVEPASELCGDWKSGPPEALAEPVEPIPPGRAGLQPRLPDSLGVSLQAEPVGRAELAFAARLQAEPVAKAELAFAARLQAEPVAKAELAVASRLDAEPVVKAEWAFAARLQAEPVVKAELASTARLDAEPVVKAEWASTARLDAEPDRKSTRLNSSH